MCDVKSNPDYYLIAIRWLISDRRVNTEYISLGLYVTIIMISIPVPVQNEQETHQTPKL